MRPFAELVSIGKIVKPQGRKGEVLVAPFSDRPLRFPELKQVFLPAADGGTRLVPVSHCWPHKDRFVLKLQGVESIDDAEALRGLEVRIGEEELAVLPAGEYYHHQLKGLTVVTVEGEVLGEAKDIMETGAAPVLVVHGRFGAETLIPMAETFILSVDLAARRIVAVKPRLVEADGGRTPAAHAPAKA